MKRQNPPPVGTAAFQLARARKRLANSFAQALELLPQVHFGHAIWHMRILRFCISKGGLPLPGAPGRLEAKSPL